MTITVGINGFGRIGRATLAHISESLRNDIKVVKVNATGPIETAAHLMRYDSVHGRFAHPITVEGNTMDLGRGPIEMYSTYDMTALDWEGVDVVMECTGKFNDGLTAKTHLERGARKVLLSAPGKNVDRTVVYGVNHDTLRAGERMISNGSCTTNCLAPLAKVLNDGIGIESGIMTTIHAYTGDQRPLDTLHSDPRRARACGVSMIPTSTGAAKAVGLVLPELQGKLDGTAIRVPTPNVSLIDLTFTASKSTTAEEINAAMEEAANGRLKGVLGYNTKPLVSIDFNHNPASSTFDASQTQVIDGNFVRVLSWYDNEWGFSNRMPDTALAMHGAS